MSEKGTAASALADIANRLLDEKDAEITSLRAQLAEAKEALKFASETVAGLAATVADLRSELAEARAKFEEILKKARPHENDDDLLCVIALLAEDFLDPSKRAPLREKLASLKDGNDGSL